MSLIFSMFKTSCFVVFRKSCIIFVFSYLNLHEYSGVTVSMVAFQAGVQDSNPTLDKFFSWQIGKYFHKIVSCKSCIMFIFSYVNLYEYSGEMVSIVAFRAGNQGSKFTWIYFFLLNGHIFLKFYNFIFLNSILEPYKHTLCQYVSNDLIHQNVCTKFRNFANFFSGSLLPWPLT